MYIHNAFLFQLIQKFPILSKFITATDGWRPDEYSDQDYIFGGEKLGKYVLQEDGQWLNYLPDDEIQKGSRVETMGCTGYALLNIFETLAKKDGKNWNKADRYTNKMTGTTSSGNSMRNVLDITRKTAGVVNEASWPWDRATFSWSNYYSSIPAEVQKLGADWLKEYAIGYEDVSLNPQLMMSALKYSPLYVAGYAWYESGGLYRSYGQANHCFTIVGYVEGSHWLAYDSYSPFVKKLAWDYLFGACKLVVLEKKIESYSQAEINKLIARGFKFIMRTDKINGGLGQIYELTNSGLKELSDQEKKDWAVRALADRKDLTGISEIDYYKLLK